MQNAASGYSGESGAAIECNNISAVRCRSADNVVADLVEKPHA
jgi:hypothetical protein